MTRRLLLRGFAVMLAIVGFSGSCSDDGETTDWCSDACAIWSECTGWDVQACMSECRAEGDWDAEYLACIRNQGCGNLRACE